MKKNVFILILCALMVFGSIPKSVKAEETEGSEAGINYTVDNPENNINEPNHGNIDVDEDDAIHLEVDGEGSEIVIGAKNVSSSDDDGVSVYAYNKGTATVTVENVKAEDDAILVDVGSQGNTNITTGDIEAGYYGINIETSSGGSATITTGDIVSEHEGITGEFYDSDNVTINTGSITSNKRSSVVIDSIRSTVNITVDGDITSKNNGYTGIDARSYYDGTTNINVSGNVVGTDSGINVLTDTGGKTIIVVEGDVKAEGTAINVEDYDEPMEDTSVGIIVNGNISGGDGADLYADSNANVFLSAEGSIKGDCAIYLTGDDKAKFTVDAKNIEGSEAAMYLSLYDNSEAEIEADTIKGGEVAIVLDDYQDQSTKNIKIVAWKIELNKDGNVAENIDDSDTTSPNKAFEKNKILYVLKLEQPEEGGDIALDMEREIDTFYDDEAWAAVKEETKVYVNVNLKEGYMITGLYNGKGEKQELEKDDKGYYIVVPKGGGVYLTALLQAYYNPQPAPSSDDDSDSDYDYSVIDQTKGSQVIRGGESYFVRINAPINDYDSTWVDNKNVSKFVTVTEGSTIVTLDPGFLSTLSVGWHNLMVKFKSGREVFSRFVITKSNSAYKVPTTGVDRISHQYKGYSVALFAIVSSIAIIKSKKAYKVR